MGIAPLPVKGAVASPVTPQQGPVSPTNSLLQHFMHAIETVAAPSQIVDIKDVGLAQDPTRGIQRNIQGFQDQTPEGQVVSWFQSIKPLKQRSQSFGNTFIPGQGAIKTNYATPVGNPYQDLVSEVQKDNF